jgi:hypothetical protein
MKLDFKGSERTNTKIQGLIDILESAKDMQLWEHVGLKVEIDPTIDYNSENILVRWLDIVEGFNDKIIVNSLNEFNVFFKPVN